LPRGTLTPPDTQGRRFSVGLVVCGMALTCVEAEVTIQRAARAAGGTGMFVKSPNGCPIQSPWLGISNRAIKLYMSNLAEFGPLPAARCRVTPSEMQLALPGPGDSIEGEVSGGDPQ
jgi:hypothetical protein